MIHCKHVYAEPLTDTCEYCGANTHKTDWEEQHALHKDWILSGKAVAQGWWSI